MSSPRFVKCLVWDLDGTLWTGTLLEGSAQPVSPALRQVVEELDRRGVLQSVASRNDPDHAWTRIEDEGLADHFLVPQIGWGAKSAAISRITECLDFASSTMAFIDDNPVDRSEVAYALPEVRCYDASRALDLPGLEEFSPPVTADSTRRRSLYRARFRREEAQAECEGLDEAFLRTLGLKMTIRRAARADLDRVAELTLRTSQMNATGVCYSVDDLGAALTDPQMDVMVADLVDSFGEYGTIAVVVLGRTGDAWRIKFLATSCRVVTVGAGVTILRWLTDAASRVAVRLEADLLRTERNRIMEIAYRFAGFACDRQLEPGDRAVLVLEPRRQSAPPATEVVAATPFVRSAPPRPWTWTS